MSVTRRELLLAGAAAGLTACLDGGASGPGGGTEGAGDGGAPCARPSDGTQEQYCLTEALQVRVPGAARLEVGEAVLLNVDDDTAVIVARDASGLHALSGICTHACCIVSLCDDDACSRLSLTPPACGATQRAQAAHAGGGILCPCHGSVFRVVDGAPLSGPATTPLPAYALVLDGDAVVVDTGTRVDATIRV